MAKAELMHRWFEEVWNNRNADAIDEMFAIDGIAHGLKDPQGNPIIGPSGYKPFHAAFLNAFPDLKVTIEDTVTEGDKIAVRCRVNGTHCGEGIGITPCSTPVEFTLMTIVRVTDGRIAEAWNNVDFMEMYQQLGALKLELKETEGV
jgi:predicted ester cyclase